MWLTAAVLAIAWVIRTDGLKNVVRSESIVVGLLTLVTVLALFEFDRLG
jgi:hypothetical protein